jgi:hypothetical protein
MTEHWRGDVGETKLIIPPPILRIDRKPLQPEERSWQQKWMLF